MDGGYWGVMPGEVLHDKELTAAGKLLYLLLSSMAHSSGYCWPSNETLAAELGLSKRRVRELLAALQERGYIRVEVRRAEDTNEVERRYIYCGLFPGREAPAPSGENLPDPPAEDRPPSGEISPDPPAKSRHCIKCMNHKEELPPLPPTGEKRAKAKRDKSVPRWKPERFEAFWNFYRTNVRGEDRQGAVSEWDRLKPDDELIAVMGRALKAQLRSEDWQRGIGIPYARRWLKNKRWLDSPKAAAAEETPPGSGGKSWEERWESEFGWH